MRTVMWSAVCHFKLTNTVWVLTYRHIICVVAKKATQHRTHPGNYWRELEWAPEERDVRYNKYKSVSFLSPFTSLFIKPTVITTVGLIKFLCSARWEDRQPTPLKRALSESLRSAIISL